MTPLPERVLYYGKDEPLPVSRELRAGPLRLRFENGAIRYVRLGNQELLRNVYAAVRDRNWGTVPGVLSGLQIEAGSDSFSVRFESTHRDGPLDFSWNGTLLGTSDGGITFMMDGQARATFWRNRIGFCVLHPAECAGCRCTVEKADGSFEHGAFPGPIAPHAPFKDMRAIAHEVAPGLWAEVRFSGDVFEMEDQRNWTDASFKTFCTPLALPYPVEIPRGTRVQQSVTLTLRGIVPAGSVRMTDAAPVFSVGSAPAGPLPRLGLGVASHGRPLSRAEIGRLRALNLSHLRADLHLSQPGYELRFRQAVSEAAALSIPLELALFLSDAAAEELTQFTRVLGDVRPNVASWIILHTRERTTPEPCIRLAREALGSYNPSAKLGAGTDADFVNLNRRPPAPELLDFACYPVSPQVHAFDNASLVETLAAQAATVASGRLLFNGLPLAVTPVTLKRRWNPDATGPEPDPVPGEIPPQVDVRQMSLFGAGWTLGSLKYLAESGVASVTYYETTGRRGVMETEAGSALPDRFRSWPGAVFPLYHVLADVGEFAGGTVVPTASSDALRVDGIALERHGRRRVLLANLGPEPLSVRVQGLPGAVHVRQLDATNAGEAMQFPEQFRAGPGDVRSTSAGGLTLDLKPYGLARLDNDR